MDVRRLIPVFMALLLAVGSLALWTLTPRLVEFSPAEGAERVRGAEPLRLAFSRPMLPETVAGRLAVEPQVEGQLAWEGNTLTFTPAEPWPAGATISVRLEAGARSGLGLPLLGGTEWSFTTARVRLAYLYPSEGPAEVYAFDLLTGESERLTETEGVYDFDVSADGAAIYFSAEAGGGASDLFALDLTSGQTRTLLDCGPDFCRAPRVSPDGGQVAFERTFPAQGGGSAYPQVWLLPLEGGEPRQVSEPRHPARLPTWSPDGLLSYYDEREQAFIILDTASGESTVLTNQTGEQGSWSPNGVHFVVPELFVVPGVGDEPPLLSGHLLDYNYASGETVDLTEEDDLEDTFPAFSPDGSQIAFARKSLDRIRWTPGRQLWLLRTASGAARVLTDQPDFKHTHFAWHPNGEQIAYVRFNQVRLTEPPEIWLIHVRRGEPVLLVKGGYDPQWIP